MDHEDPERIAIEDVKVRMDRGDRIILIDSRSSIAWGRSGVKIPGALRIPDDEIQQNLDELPKGVPIVVYCA
jgi:rhodanese-related sulfurtransferase